MPTSNADFYLWSGSSPESLRKLKNSIRGMKKWPLQLHYTRQVLDWASEEESDVRFYLAGSDEQRAKTLRILLEDPKVENIFCTRGGYGAIRVLEVLDKWKIHPKGKKVVWGYSDSTIIQMYLFQRFGWTWVHAPMLCSQSWQEPDSRENKAFRDLFKKDGFNYQKNLKIWNLGNKSIPKKIQLLGGNLMSIVSMFGRDWLKKPKQPFFLFLEDITEGYYKIDRLISVLGQSKFFENCQGILLGHFTDCPGYRDILKIWAKERGLFLASRIDAGHESPNVPLYMGDKIEIRKISSKEVKVIFPSIKLETGED
jgi:muramoyltetrapeptide carboxypeptidase